MLLLLMQYYYTVLYFVPYLDILRFINTVNNISLASHYIGTAYIFIYILAINFLHFYTCIVT